MRRLALVVVALLSLSAVSCIGPLTRFRCPPCSDTEPKGAQKPVPCVTPEPKREAPQPKPAKPEPRREAPAAPASQPADRSRCNPGQALLNATLWVQSSAEYRAVTTQIYTAARHALDAALADKTWIAATEDNAESSASQQPAIIMDTDETVIDNTRFQGRVIAEGKTYDSEIWDQWTAESAGAAIAGASEFINYAREKGVKIFFITNRNVDEEVETRRNLERLGFPVTDDPDTLLMRAERSAWQNSDKSLRREWVGSMYRIVLVLGDDLNDFTSVTDKSMAERDEIVARTKSWWGTRWFMIPNPMYGSWERAVSGGDGTQCDQLQIKMDALRK